MSKRLTFDEMMEWAGADRHRGTWQADGRVAVLMLWYAMQQIWSLQEQVEALDARFSERVQANTKPRRAQASSKANTSKEREDT